VAGRPAIAGTRATSGSAGRPGTHPPAHPRGTPLLLPAPPQNDGQLVVQDGSGAVTWSSRNESGTSSAAQQGWTYQLTSGGGPGVSCILSGPTPAPVRLLSPGSAYSLQLAREGAALRLVDVAGAQVWAPQGALPGSPPVQLCVTRSGGLQLSGAGSRQLWASSYAVSPGAKGPFTAIVSSKGCLEVHDGSCARLYSSTSIDSKNGVASRLPSSWTSAAASGAAKTPTPTPPKLRPTHTPASKPSKAVSRPALSKGRAASPATRPPKPVQAAQLKAAAASSTGACKLPPGGVCGGVNL
jgi:hypothetical protein